MGFKAELIRCLDHGASACWQQFDGSHKQSAECTCEQKPPYLCPIDAHSVRYLLDNPEWEDPPPAPAAKPKPQDCDHRGAKELVELPGQIRAWLCKACRLELVGRTEEVFKPDTPIELYAKRPPRKRGSKPMPGLAGCTYNVGKKDKPHPCGLVCDEGKTMCPRHDALWPIEVAKQREKELKRLDKKVANTKGVRA